MLQGVSLTKIKLAFVGTGELTLKYYLPEASENPELFEIVGISTMRTPTEPSL